MRSVIKEEWSERELKDLKSALNLYCLSNLTALQKHVQTKTTQQVSVLIKKCQSFEKGEKLPRIEAPIECWTELASKLIFLEDIDHSENLSRAMSLVSAFEGRESTDHDLKVDYKHIYKYLGEILKGVETDMTLPPLEACIVLDLMHGMTSELQKKNTKVHEMVMKWKYKLLSSKIDLYKKHLQAESFQKALSNDFTDLLNSETNKSSKQQNNSPRSSGNKRKADQTNNNSEPTPSTSGREEGSSTLSQSQRDSLKSGEPAKKSARLVKPKLFTINPFCIPVSLVKLKDLK